MRKQIHSVLTTILVLLAHFTFAQNSNSVLDNTLANLQKQASTYPFEKVYLHFDKPYYGAGDTIWFKGYDLIGAEHHLSALSSVLNVELVDEHNVIARSIKLPLISGITQGDFPLADTIHEGTYRLRAYTTWMRNAGDEYFFDKTVKLVNAALNKVLTSSNFTYILSNQQQTVNATIIYTDVEGKPYPGKQVKYTVNIPSQKITNGQGVTNEKGELHITFVNPSPDIVSGFINTTLQLDNQKTVNKIVSIKSTASKVDVQFFPEGGALINGIPSKVAFKAVGADGLGVDIKGMVVDDQNNEIAAINTMHLGMGAFRLLTEAGKVYKANIIYTDGSTGTIALPAARDKGYVMAVDSRSDSLNIRVKITGDESQAGGFTLVAQSGGNIYLQSKGVAGKKSFVAVIPRDKLPSGIIQFTLFSDSGEPLNERLLFMQNPDQLKLEVTAEKQNYPPHQKVKLALNAKTNDGKPAQGNFSVSVIDESKVPVDENNENSILSNILLTSDLRGYIEQPNYYFANINEQTAADLDILMLTQGYRRFEWKQVAAGGPPNISYQPEKILTIAGTVIDENGKPVPEGRVTLINTSGSLFARDTVADKNGRFAFNLNFKDSTKFTIKATSANKQQEMVMMDSSPLTVKTNKNAADIDISIDKRIEPYLHINKEKYDAEVKSGLVDRTITLKQVNIKTQRPKTEREIKIEHAVAYSSNLNGKGVADQVITGDQLEGHACLLLKDCLTGIVNGVYFKTNGTAYSSRVSTNFGGRLPMLVIFDGISGVNLNDISATEIESVEVLKSAEYIAIYGSQSSGGVLVITSKHGNEYRPGPNFGSGLIRPPGFYISREFYSPQYDNPKTNTQVADLRTTIFWKPIVQTDKDGNAVFEYFNASKGIYRVVVEGINYATGSIGRQIYRYKVE